jgi:hypothetical protein
VRDCLQHDQWHADLRRLDMHVGVCGRLRALRDDEHGLRDEHPHRCASLRLVHDELQHDCDERNGHQLQYRRL